MDSIQSVRIATGRGDIQDVSAQSYADLYWGIQGTGHNFGIITSAKYQVYDFTSKGQAMNADFRIKASGAAGVFNYMRSYQRNNLSFEVSIAYNATYGGVGFPS